MISCERAQSLFGPGWDDELSVAERESLEQHFAGCSPCRRDYDELARTLELVQGLPRPQVSGDFATRVLVEARRREAEGGRGLLITRGWFAHPARLAIAAALVVAAGVSGLMLSPKPQRVAQQVAAPAPVVATIAPVVTPPSQSASAGPVSPARSNAKPTLARPQRNRPAEVLAAVPDSLFDHTADVELVLDPVTLRKERGRGYTPVQTTVKGEQASITF
jgi:anti-sigma factor RsiW